MSLPTQQEIFEGALAQLDRARAALAECRDHLNSDWGGVTKGLTLPLEVGQRRTRVRASIAGAKDQIDDARHELHAVLRHYVPPAPGHIVDDSGTETADGHSGR